LEIVPKAIEHGIASLERPLFQASHVARVFVFSIATSASGKIR